MIGGSGQFEERELDGAWVTRQISRGDIFVTRLQIPYELRWNSPRGEELDVLSVHVAVEQFLAALEVAYPSKTMEVEVLDFFGRDEALAYLCFACAEMLSEKVSGQITRVAALTHQQFVALLAEKYTNAAPEKLEFRGGLPVRQLRKVAGIRYRRT